MFLGFACFFYVQPLCTEIACVLFYKAKMKTFQKSGVHAFFE